MKSLFVLQIDMTSVTESGLCLGRLKEP